MDYRTAIVVLLLGFMAMMTAAIIYDKETPQVACIKAKGKWIPAWLPQNGTCDFKGQ